MDVQQVIQRAIALQNKNIKIAEQILAHCKVLHQDDGFVRAEETIENSRLIIDALEKQIPKGPCFVGSGANADGNEVYGWWQCPSCGEEYDYDYDRYGYCPHCGQAIDLSETQDDTD